MWPLILVVSQSALFPLVAVEAQHMPDNRTCEEGWKEYGGHCYWFSGLNDGEFNANETDFLCRSKKAAVISIHSMEENRFARDTMASTWPAHNQAHIGYRCQQANGSWTDGSLVDYKNVYTHDCNYHPTIFLLYSGPAYDSWAKWMAYGGNKCARVICKKPKPQ